MPKTYSDVNNNNSNSNSNSNNNFEIIPNEILLHMISFLSPEDLFILSRVNTNFYDLATSIWLGQMAKHFPHRFIMLEDKENIDWYAELNNAYTEEYQNLDPKIIKILTLVKEGDLESLAKIDITPDELDCKDNKGRSILDWAKQTGNSQILNHFYNHIVLKAYTENNSIDFAREDSKGRNILSWAIKCQQDIECIRSLIQQAGDTLQSTIPTMINFAAAEGLQYVVQEWLEQTPELLNKPTENGMTILMTAAAKGHLSLVEYLLAQENINLNVQYKLGSTNENAGQTALHFAIENGHHEVVAALIRAGANLTLPTIMGIIQPIDLAVRKGHLPTVELLINCESVAKNIWQQTSQLLISAVNHGHPHIVEYLLSMKSAIDFKDVQKAFVQAILDGKLEIIKAFIKANPKLLNAPINMFCETPLIWAAKLGYVDVVKYLVSRKDIDLTAHTQNRRGKYETGRTALHWAAKQGRNEVVQVLIEALRNANLKISRKVNKDNLSKEVKAEVVKFEKTNLVGKSWFRFDFASSSQRNSNINNNNNNNNNSNNDNNGDNDYERRYSINLS